MEKGGNKTEALLERIADSLEKLASDPEIEIEAGPPVCPNCGKFDPVIRMSPDNGGEGPMSQVYVDAACTECGSAVYIIIDSYSVHKSRATAIQELEERTAGNGKNA